VLPTLRVVPNPQVAQYGMVESIGWTGADRRHALPHLRRRPGQGEGRARQVQVALQRQDLGRAHAEEHQKFPGDTEAQVGQGPITFHSEEHLMSSDQGVAMLRQMFQRQLDALGRRQGPGRRGVHRSTTPM
jgi:hypothetical protein